MGPRGVPSPARLRESDFDSGPVSKSVKRGVASAVTCVSWSIYVSQFPGFRISSHMRGAQYVQSERRIHEQLREIDTGGGEANDQ
jgi:hypothetical protein